MSHLTEYELEELLDDAARIDTYLSGRREFVTRPALYPRLLRLIAEQRELRDQAGERERMHAQELES